MNASETMETQIRMNEFQTAMGNMIRNPRQIMAIMLYSPHSTNPFCLFPENVSVFKEPKTLTVG